MPYQAYICKDARRRIAGSPTVGYYSNLSSSRFGKRNDTESFSPSKSTLKIESDKAIFRMVPFEWRITRQTDSLTPI